MLALSATHVAAAILGSALLLLTLADGAHGAFEAPESVHRRAFFQLDSKRLSQAMWLDGAVNHGVPSRFPCSSLEGAACLYSSPERSRFAEGAHGMYDGYIALYALHCSKGLYSKGDLRP